MTDIKSDRITHIEVKDKTIRKDSDKEFMARVSIRDSAKGTLTINIPKDKLKHYRRGDWVKVEPAFLVGRSD